MFASLSNPLCESRVQALSSKDNVLQQALRRVTERTSAFFFGNGAETAPDNLVEIVRRNPAAASTLLRTISWFSAIGNMVSATCCGAFLWLHWGNCASCDRPLRWWLLVQAVLQLCQLPVRVVLLHSMRRAEELGSDLQERIASLTSSQAWQMSKKVAVFQYGWFVLGMVWWMHTDVCPDCPAASRLMAAVMALSALRAGAAICIFRACFGNEDAPDKAPAAVAATNAQITALPAFRFAEQGEEPEPCSICLSGFCDGVLLRRLPCGHHFHRHCIDKWLRRNKRCPLCMHSIDAGCSRALRPRSL